MKVVVTGSSGFLGGALAGHLQAEGHEVVPLLRPGSTRPTGSAIWDPARGTLDAAAVDGAAAVVHLAGAPIGARPWTPAYKQRILRSRVAGTRLLAGTLAGLARPPAVLLSASAIGWYGDRGDDVLTEDEPAGPGFRADVCRRWEAATVPAAEAGIRVALLRFGMVLGHGGGLLPVLLAPARLGIGIRLGDGRQWVSWVSLHDAVAAATFALTATALRGPVNVCSPNPVTNAELARATASVLGRPRIGWAPRWALGLVAGRERAGEVLLSSQRVLPTRLLAAGFGFRHPEIEAALAAAVHGPPLLRA